MSSSEGSETCRKFHEAGGSGGARKGGGGGAGGGGLKLAAEALEEYTRKLLPIRHAFSDLCGEAHVWTQHAIGEAPPESVLDGCILFDCDEGSDRWGEPFFFVPEGIFVGDEVRGYSIPTGRWKKAYIT